LNTVSRTTRVQVVDNHAVVRLGLQFMLEGHSDIEVVVKSDCGKCAIHDYSKHQPDIVIMALSMAGISGTEAMRHILAKDLHAKVIVFSFHHNPVLISRVMQSRAMGYLCKRCDSEVLITAVRQVAHGNKYIDPGLSGREARKETSGANGPLQRLTMREFEIFLMLADGKSAKDIAKILHLSPNTVRNHQNSIMHKLNISNKAKLVHIALQAGLLND